MTAARAQAPLDTTTEEECPTCGARVSTRFCPACGEERASERHYSLRHLGEELVESLVHADGRALRTIRTLVARPGALTTEYMRGARKPYLAPLQLFFLVNVVFFLWAGVTHVNMFSTPLRFHVQGTFYSDQAASLVNARLAARHATFATYAAAFDHAAALQSKSLIILMVPLLAVVIAIVSLPGRRAAVQHVVFALHTMTMLLLLTIALGTCLGIFVAVIRALGIQIRWQIIDQASAILLVLLVGIYVHRAVGRAYGWSGATGTLRAIAFAAALIPALFLYRAALFFTTFYTT